MAILKGLSGRLIAPKPAVASRGNNYRSALVTAGVASWYQSAASGSLTQQEPTHKRVQHQLLFRAIVNARPGHLVVHDRSQVVHRAAFGRRVIPNVPTAQCFPSYPTRKVSE